TSSTRQLAVAGSLLCSISDADPNSFTSRPTDWKRLLSARRTDSSSSTTSTVGPPVSVVADADFRCWLIGYPCCAGAGQVGTLPRDPHCLMQTCARREPPQSNGR